MSAPAPIDDVLAVLDRLLTFASRGVERDDPARELIEDGYEARAAAVGLIEADLEYDAALAAYNECAPVRKWHSHAHAVELGRHRYKARERLNAAKSRRTAALARARGDK